MKPKVLMDYIIKPALAHLAEVKPKADSPASRQMMLAIAAQESHCGIYFKQIKGPALGIWQVEPDTANDLYNNYLKYDDELMDHVSAMIPMVSGLADEMLVASPLYCCAIARLCLYRHSDPMPELNDMHGMFEMYKKLYNSVDGKATYTEWVANWQKYVAGVDCE